VDFGHRPCDVDDDGKRLSISVVAAISSMWLAARAEGFGLRLGVDFSTRSPSTRILDVPESWPMHRIFLHRVISPGQSVGPDLNMRRAKLGYFDAAPSEFTDFYDDSCKEPWH
jgi:hypothetical protein